LHGGFGWGLAGYGLLALAAIATYYKQQATQYLQHFHISY
jgi:hypothetical protein